MKTKLAKNLKYLTSNRFAEVCRCSLALICLFALMLAVVLLLSGWTYIGEPEPAPTYSLEHQGVYTVTAYCACPKCCGKAYDDPAYGITATGTTVTEGRTIAVDPKVIPYGTEVFFDGKGYIAEDCGGFKGRHIDVYIADHNEALEYGLQEWDVCFLEGGW